MPVIARAAFVIRTQWNYSILGATVNEFMVYVQKGMWTLFAYALFLGLFARTSHINEEVAAAQHPLLIEAGIIVGEVGMAVLCTGFLWLVVELLRGTKALRDAGQLYSESE
jgi:hypothetical protein